MDSIFGLGFILGFVIGIICAILIADSQVQAIDVYRGKTELIVTYKSDVAVDSVVVYKKFDYGK